jgi:hypothetical protein
VYTSIGFANASVQAVKCLAETDLIDLTRYSSTLPHTITAIGHCTQLAVKLSELFQSCMASRNSGPSCEALISVKADKKRIWQVLDYARAALGWVSTILSMIAFYFSISLSSYWLLGVSTFMFLSSLAIDLQPNLP